MPPPFYGSRPEDGLHVLKDRWKQKRYLREQSEALAKGLPVAIKATYEAAHVRTPNQGFFLNRTKATVKEIDQTEEERRLETAMMRRWSTANMWRIPGAWSRLVSCQVPLFRERDRQGWGYIDLLGVSRDGLPVVVELKKSPGAQPDGRTGASETPLKMLLQASAYAVSLRKMWNQEEGDFRTQWMARLNEIGFPDGVVNRISTKLTTVRLVAAAPAAFWMEWLPVTTKGQSVPENVWPSFRKLLTALGEGDLPTSFVSISGHAENPASLGVQPLVGFPPG